MFPGITELIQELKARSYQLGIVTSRLWESTRQGLYKFDIAGMFDAVVSAEDTTVHKPDPTPCLICLENLALMPTRRFSSVTANSTCFAQRMQALKSVLVGWSICVSEEEKEGIYKPDYYIEKPEELLGIL